MFCCVFRKRTNVSPIRIFINEMRSLGDIEAYDRRDKPSVLVTSPSSPDRVASGASAASSRYQSRLTAGGPVSADSNIGGRIQIKLGFEPGTLQLILTIICATGLTYRANGATRNPYVKVTNHREGKTIGNIFH